ncbi:hypothetical protein BJX61DRAFT_534352 [Aspergillus egyptiacus]|nr:hypothetical protein BJX61DRAFT_534352 [Aspergillus egyptiacus]
MSIRILFHPQLRSALSGPMRRELCRSLVSVRLTSTQNVPRPSKSEATPFKPKDIGASGNSSPRTSLLSATDNAKTNIRKGPPERILIYHGGTGRTMFLGVLRITTIFLFGASCLVVAPAFMSDDFPRYLGPAVMAAGALPMLFVSYTAAPYVNFVHLALPFSARRSREKAIQYAKNLPPTATLYINTMKFSTIPRQTEVRLGDLVPDKSLVRPVSFRNKNPAPLPFWRIKTLQQFYTANKSNPGKESATFYPGLWEHVYEQIHTPAIRKTN